MRSRRLLILGLGGVAAPLSGGRSYARGLLQPCPPRMVLRAGGRAQRAALGTFCWDGHCVDTSSVVYYPDLPLIVVEGEALGLEFGALGALRRIEYSLWPYAENIQPGPPNWSAKTSANPVHEDVFISPVSPAPLSGHLPPGLYVIDVFARARHGGSTYQGFKLLVEPAGAAATPVAMPAATPVVRPFCEDAGG